MKQRGHLVVLVLWALIVLRSVIFSQEFGGVEQDSGIFIGMAHSLATRGAYGCEYNYMPNARAYGENIHERWGIQSTEGVNLFCEAAIGPGYVFPQALVFKIFGTDWLTIRAIPLLSFAGLIFLLLSLALSWSGVGAVIAFALWVWVHPQYYLHISYEAYSEVLTLFYLTLSFLVLTRQAKERSKKSENKKWQKWKALKAWKQLIKWWQSDKFRAVISGILWGLAIKTKLLAVITYPAVFLFLILMRTPLRNLWFLVGGFIPVAAFELYQLAYLTLHFDAQAYLLMQKTYFSFLLFHSTITQTGAMVALQFMADKILLIWSPYHFSGPSFLLYIPAIYFTYYFYRKLEAKRARENFELYRLILLTTVGSLTWFFLLSKTGWPRHNFIGETYLTFILIVALGECLRLIGDRQKKLPQTLAIFSLAIFFFLIDGTRLDFRLLFNEETLEFWNKRRVEQSGANYNIYVSKNRQTEAIDFIRNKLTAKDKIFYVGFFYGSELTFQVSKVFFPILRYRELKETEGRNYLLLTPQYAPVPYISLKPFQEYLNVINDLCQEIVFYDKDRPFYLICELRK